VVYYPGGGYPGFYWYPVITAEVVVPKVVDFVVAVKRLEEVTVGVVTTIAFVKQVER
jgi:hypothetical protein